MKNCRDQSSGVRVLQPGFGRKNTVDLAIKTWHKTEIRFLLLKYSFYGDKVDTVCPFYRTYERNVIIVTGVCE
jgi:hypothetical protein